MSFHVVRLGGSLDQVAELPMVTEVSIERSATDEVPMLESCTVTADSRTPLFEPGWHRIEWRDGSLSHLGTFWLELDGARCEHGKAELSLVGTSVLKPCSEVTLENGSYCLGGIDGVAYVAGLLSACPGTVTASGTKLTKDPIVFDDGTTALGAAWKVLDAIGWCLRIDGLGNVSIEPLPTDVALLVDRSGKALNGIEVGDTVTYDRELADEVRPFDLVEVSLPGFGISRSGRVLSQSLEIGHGVRVTEEVGELGRGGDD